MPVTKMIILLSGLAAWTVEASFSADADEQETVISSGWAVVTDDESFRAASPDTKDIMLSSGRMSGWNICWWCAATQTRNYHFIIWGDDKSFSARAEEAMNIMLSSWWVAGTD